MITLKEIIVSDERELEDNKFSNKLTMILSQGIEGVPDFSKEIICVCDNNQTGVETDAQREAEVAAYVADLNA